MIIFSWIHEFYYWLVNALTYAIPFLHPGKPVSSDHKNPAIVILSPSYTGPILYRGEKSYFEEKGFETHVIDLAPHMRNMEGAGKRLKKIIEDLNRPNICLVGISSAGLPAYEYLNTLDGWKKVSSFVAVATPFKGTKMAYFVYHTKTGRQLVPNSKYIKSIQEIKPHNLNKTFCVVAKMDQLVPRNRSILEGAKVIEIPVIGHVTLHSFSHKTFDTIANIATGKIK